MVFVFICEKNHFFNIFKKNYKEKKFFTKKKNKREREKKKKKRCRKRIAFAALELTAPPGKQTLF